MEVYLLKKIKKNLQLTKKNSNLLKSVKKELKDLPKSEVQLYRSGLIKYELLLSFLIQG